MFDTILRMQLGPIVERLAELETELEDLRRRGENHNRIGTVVAVNPGARRCQVSHGELRTPWIKYFNPAAGAVSETRHPSVGEQCLLINYGAGDGSAQSVALCGIESASFPGVSDRAELHRRTYPDGTESAYDHASHALTWNNAPLSVKADRSGLEVMLGAVGFKLTAAGFEHVGGALTHDGINISKTHKHPPGSPLSGTPQ
jgi:phage baseplate assembly protein V